MTPPTDLPHRFAACRHWAWEEGMWWAGVSGGKGRNAWTRSGGIVTAHTNPPNDFPTPNLNPATLGCILARIRRLRDDPTICPTFTVLGGWALVSGRTGERLTAWHEDEAEAYLDGLEGCP